ncbi:MAG: DUF1311 domain-containing protein [Thiobacillus sp.]|nr:DUF1311 domain-containing protein [Thiobacillus sp.]
MALMLVTSVAHGSEDCADSPSHSEQRACLMKLATATAAEVVLVQSEVSKRIAHMDDDAEVKRKILRHFRSATEQFHRYRTSQCEFEASAGGGTGAGDLRLQCEIRLNREYSARHKKRLGIL